MSKVAPLSQVTLAYRVVGEAKTHVFTAEELPGFHIGSSSVEKAFGEAIIALGEHVSHLCGREVAYTPAMTFEQFYSAVNDREVSPLKSIRNTFVVATKSDDARPNCG